MEQCKEELQSNEDNEVYYTLENHNHAIYNVLIKWNAI